ncbi:MAG: hypothetical protein U0736_20205 [Gemmataceae bacterium]
MCPAPATGGLDVLPPLAAGLQPVALAVGDVTGDKVPDLAVATASDTLQLFLGVGNGTAYQQEHAPGAAQTAVTLVDLTGDANSTSPRRSVGQSARPAVR